MIDAGKLDQPGRGFIYSFPINQGIINSRISRGASGAAANMEQIISALDSLKGGMKWRRQGMDLKADRGHLTDLAGLTLVCDEGRGADLVNAAMEVGAGGATISRTKFLGAGASSRNPEEKRVSPAREVCSLAVGQNQVEDVIASLEQSGAFDDETHGMVMAFPVPKAFTFIKKD